MKMKKRRTAKRAGSKEFSFTAWCDDREVIIKPENCFLGEKLELIVEVQEIDSPQANAEPYNARYENISAKSEHLNLLKKKHTELILKWTKNSAKEKNSYSRRPASKTRVTSTH